MEESTVTLISSKRSRRVSLWWRLAQLIFFVLVIVSLFRYFVAQPFIVSGASMEPTFYPDEYLAIDRLTYRFEPPQRDDVIVFHYPLDPSLYFIKRIVALPGESVHISHGVIKITTVSGVVVETYDAANTSLIDVDTSDDEYEVTLAGDEYFVLGDNLGESDDSRKWGPLQRTFIIGRPVVRLWPIEKIKLFPGATRVLEDN